MNILFTKNVPGLSNDAYTQNQIYCLFLLMTPAPGIEWSKFYLEIFLKQVSKSEISMFVNPDPPIQ